MKNWTIIWKNNVFEILKVIINDSLAQMETASFYGGVRHKRYSVQLE
ncbi:hypothetical protein [Flavobacterium chungangense]|uniref:Uncharacterized protein n=1 Tax=Flavobacterium chungangense TaxID=554283 RepID=A0A6V6YU44_9FLAO|nr:hypothetical protein [Flavobacterium chungangense]CAD0003011.1 hypothetical protein FLACHUCJ7_01215 [Flavobacterium chungangense]